MTDAPISIVRQVDDYARKTMSAYREDDDLEYDIRIACMIEAARRLMAHARRLDEASDQAHKFDAAYRQSQPHGGRQ